MRRKLFSGYILFFSCFLNGVVHPSDTAVILMYHRFGEDRYPETSVRASQFEAHLELLEEGNFSVVPLSAVVALLKEGAPLPPKAVAITIDDAYHSVYETAYPRLKRYRYPFTVFVATEGVDRGFPAYMTWDQMREMEEHGASFANHGAGHQSMIAGLDGESDGERIGRVLADVETGRKRLAEELHPLTNAFAYPYGEFDTSVAERLRGMGFVCFGQHSGAVGPGSDLRALPRFPIAEAYAEIDDFRVKVSSLPLPVGTVTPWDPVVQEEFPEIVVKLGATGIPIERLSCYVGGQGSVPIRWIEAGSRFAVSPRLALSPGRQRVNCTMLQRNGRYLWFSHPWFVRPAPH